MQNLFSYAYKKNEMPEFIGRPFITQETGEAVQMQCLDIATDQQETIKKYTLPLPVRIVSFVLLLAGIIIVGALIKSIVGTSFAEVFAKVPALFFVGPLCLLAWLAIFLVALRLKKQADTSDDLQRLQADTETVTKRAAAEFNVPQNAVRIDVIALHYKDKNGKMSLLMRSAMLEEYNVFVRDEAVCFADVAALIAIPFSAVKSVRYVKKRYQCVGGWNKEEGIRSPRYKKFAIANEIGIIVRHYYRIEIADARGEFEILVPTYDFDSLSEATGYRLALTEESK